MNRMNAERVIKKVIGMGKTGEIVNIAKGMGKKVQDVAGDNSISGMGQVANMDKFFGGGKDTERRMFLCRILKDSFDDDRS